MTTKESWKPVTIGGLTGILMGAGSVYAVQSFAQNDDVTIVKPEDGLNVAIVSDDMSFEKAFETARAEVGPGGVFKWHGNIFNTYTTDEWNSLSDADKQQFAARVKPEVSPADIDTRQIAQTAEASNVQTSQGHDHQAGVTDHGSETDHTTSSSPNRRTHVASDPIGDDDVRIVGYGNIDGHIAVSYDMNGDGRADVAIIDVDDSRDMSPADVVIDRDGNTSTLGDLMDNDPFQLASQDNPDVAPDMPDYMNDVLG